MNFDFGFIQSSILSNLSLKTSGMKMWSDAYSIGFNEYHFFLLFSFQDHTLDLGFLGKMKSTG